ncbi:unnamed protein product [Cochlearia groenlandica]
MNFSGFGSPEPQQVFISFRGKDQRGKIMSFLTKELERRDVNFYIDENETRGSLLAVLFDRIKESSVALVLFSDKYPESRWCLDELVEIKKQMETGSLVVYPVFYKVKPDCIKTQSGWFGNSLLRTEDLFRTSVDRKCKKSVLATEATISRWREALVTIGGVLGFSYKHKSDEDFVSDLVAEVKKLLDILSSPKNYHQMVIENPKKPLHQDSVATSVLQSLNITISDLGDVITKPTIQINGLDSLKTDNLVFLDMDTLRNPVRTQPIIEMGKAGKILLVLLGSLKEEYISYIWLHNILIIQSELISIAESNDNLQNLPGETSNNSCDDLTCFTFLHKVMKGFATMLCPQSPSVSISFGEKQLEEDLVSSLITMLESNQISVYARDKTKERFKESKVAIVIFSAKYPESEDCLDELVEIKTLMDAGEIDPFPVFYQVKVKTVKETAGCFRNRLLKVEDKARKKIDRGSEKSILDTETRITGWRDALLSIASINGLTYPQSSLPVFVADVVTKVKERFTFRKRPEMFTSYITTDLSIEKPPMHRKETELAITTDKSFDDDLFYSLTSFLQALVIDITDFEGFTEISNGIISMSFKRHADLVFLDLSSIKDFVRFQRYDSFQVVEEVSS